MKKTKKILQSLDKVLLGSVTVCDGGTRWGMEVFDI